MVFGPLSLNRPIMSRGLIKTKDNISQAMSERCFVFRIGGPACRPADSRLPGLLLRANIPASRLDKKYPAENTHFQRGSLSLAGALPGLALFDDTGMG